MNRFQLAKLRYDTKKDPKAWDLYGIDDIPAPIILQSSEFFDAFIQKVEAASICSTQCREDFAALCERVFREHCNDNKLQVIEGYGEIIYNMYAPIFYG